ncbi:hypothetical protein EUBVEN_00550 [Eubacterium ventriosum ATCC 27560]|uniref:Uncharacterized protein n=1 Tax=Eubacterium ventriosum ATCC 27560 TaxID=411463 RepID=A5Z4C5_9FIRM|nr:hypothetical protein EUBVEN_00550 [Eubacterium ventriosum ATCC 27560]
MSTVIRYKSICSFCRISCSVLVAVNPLKLSISVNIIIIFFLALKSSINLRTTVKSYLANLFN